MALGGILLSPKVLNPVEHVNLTSTNFTRSDFNCSDAIDKYQKCVDDLLPFRKLCQDFVGKNCSDISDCQTNCLPNYNEDLKTCPCQVNFKLQIYYDLFEYYFNF